ncbi:hypothetical protein [Alkalispirochaeta americana]|uniref:hypothetical protein n=1 Tax=Alkalispirochaeta americana TaxID=159291 RepID=UPI00117A14FF|nr:hypothetical protein [Alkalispirochaeta americana]
MVTCRHITGIAPAFALALIILLGSCTTPGGAADQESRQGVLPDEDVTLDEDDPEPLLTITAIILELHWTTPRTQLILDHSPLLKRVFAGDPQVVSFADRDPRRSTRLVFRFHVNTTAAPPFVSDPDRFINPQLYE